MSSPWFGELSNKSGAQADTKRHSDILLPSATRTYLKITDWARSAINVG